MAATKSISEVKDLYDLIELYANLDKNADGLLGPGEVSADEIKAGDREGPFTEAPDGFLQPWEVMKMRGFDSREISRTKEAQNGIQLGRFAEILSLDKDLEIDGIRYQAETKLAFSVGARVEYGVLANDAVLPMLPGITFPKHSLISFAAYSATTRRVYVELGADAIINGIACKKGTSIYFCNGMIEQIHSKQGFSIGNVRYTSAYLTGSSVRTGTLAEKTSLKVNSSTAYPFMETINFRWDGMVSSGILAEDVPSPYGGTIVHSAGSAIGFYPDGRPVEGSPECFKARFPGIILSGSVSEQDILLAMETFSQLSPQTLANIKGLRFQYEELPTVAGNNNIGYANPFNKTIYLRKGIFPHTFSTITHEAAHIRHLTLQDETTKRIATATRHLDLSKPEDIAEDAAIAQQIFSSSFDAKWSRAAGYDFSYSAADVISYFRAIKRHDKEGYSIAPQEGFASGYGRASIWEDVATIVEMIYKNPKRYAELINADSKFYEGRKDSGKVATIYRKKLDLLLEYNFITSKIYRQIVPVHPSPAAFCAVNGVNCP